MVSRTRNTDGVEIVVNISLSRLCDLTSLKRGRRQAEGADRSAVKGLKGNKKNKELRLGDITSWEETDHSDDQTNSEDNRDEFEGFQVLQPRKHY